MWTSNPQLLHRVLGNMLKNALEVSGAGETARLVCQLQGGQVEFWVNNPRVMPREVQLQLFQRSSSTKGKHRGQGTYSMKLLTERYLQGSISFTVSEEEGPRFSRGILSIWPRTSIADIRVKFMGYTGVYMKSFKVR